MHYASVDWDTQVITVPVNFHIFHDGETGKQFTCKYSETGGFEVPAGGNCEFVKDQMRVLNRGFRGVIQDDQPTSYNDDTKIQFCLQGANDVRPLAEYDDNSLYDDANNEYKQTFRRGGSETLNIWVNLASGALGYAT